MRFPRLLRTSAAIAAFASVVQAQEEKVAPDFQAHTLDKSVQIGYGVAVADVDGDKLLDVLLADKKQFVWYRNPGAAGITGPWQKHLLAENLTARDNVCIAARDIDGDGKCEIAVGAEWNPSDTEKSGAVFYLIPPVDRTQPWQALRLHAEPTTHRMRWLRINASSSDGATESGSWGLVVAPLHGRGNKGGEGAGVKVLLYHPPAKMNDTAGGWRTELISESMHMTHNFDLIHATADSGATVLLAGKEGLFSYQREGEKWVEKRVVSSESTTGFRGAGEVRQGRLDGDRSFIAAVEPMHGNALAVYQLNGTGGPKRQALTEGLVEGHALACGDISSAGADQIVVGYRGNAQQLRPVGIKLFTPDAEGAKWAESWIDENGMACEDLLLADLDADGKRDIVASGRSTRNLKIYLNRRSAQAKK